MLDSAPPDLSGAWWEGGGAAALQPPPDGVTVVEVFDPHSPRDSNALARLSYMHRPTTRGGVAVVALTTAENTLESAPASHDTALAPRKDFDKSPRPKPARDRCVELRRQLGLPFPIAGIPLATLSANPAVAGAYDIILDASGTPVFVRGPTERWITLDAVLRILASDAAVAR